MCRVLFADENLFHISYEAGILEDPVRVVKFAC